MLPYLVKCIPNLHVSQLCLFRAHNNPWSEKTKKIDENDKTVKDENINFEPLRALRFQLNSMDLNRGNDSELAFADLISLVKRTT
jgi:hypothetical protein